MRVKLKKPIPQEESLHNLLVVAEVDTEYEVFALFTPENRQYGDVFICIADDRYEGMHHTEQEPYPVFVPLSCFEIIEPQVRKEWELAYWDNEEVSGYLLTFPEWARDDAFYYWLVDGRKKELITFAQYYKNYYGSEHLDT